jgi:hypothetical protein
MAAFYPDLRCSFYRRWVRRTIVLWQSAVIRVEGEQIVHRLSEILLAAQVTLSRLHRGVPEQELNLLQLPAAAVAELRAGSPQVVGSDVLQPGSLAATLDHVSHHILRDPPPPDFSRPSHGSEDPPLRDTSG